MGPEVSSAQDVYDRARKLFDDCKEFMDELGLKGRVRSDRMKQSLDRSEHLLEEAKPYALGSKFATVVPVGSNHAGKSFFINNISLRDNLAELFGAKVTDDQKEKWANCFPVESTSIGREAVTVCCTRICPNQEALDKAFAARLIIVTRDVFKRREDLYNETKARIGDEQIPPVPSREELVTKLISILKKSFPKDPKIQSMSGELPEEIMLQSAPNSRVTNIFEQLAEYRAKVKHFESVIRDNPFVSWLFELHIQGAFENLRTLKIQFADVLIL